MLCFVGLKISNCARQEIYIGQTTKKSTNHSDISWIFWIYSNCMLVRLLEVLNEGYLTVNQFNWLTG